MGLGGPSYSRVVGPSTRSQNKHQYYNNNILFIAANGNNTFNNQTSVATHFSIYRFLSLYCNSLHAN